MRHQCACRPGCLTWLTAADVVTETAVGPALTVHLMVTYPDTRDDEEVFAC